VHESKSCPCISYRGYSIVGKKVGDGQKLFSENVPVDLCMCADDAAVPLRVLFLQVKQRRRKIFEVGVLSWQVNDADTIFTIIHL